MDVATTKHRLIPVTLTPELMGQWITKNAKETFKHQTKMYYSDVDLNERSRLSCKSGVQIIDLEEIMAKVKLLCENGIPEDGTPVMIEIKPTPGLKVLKSTRKQLDIEVRQGYEEVSSTVYGIPDAESCEMVYFTITGDLVPDRPARPLSPREKQDYVGFFMGGSGGSASRNVGN